MAITISTHNGTKICEDHNLRTPELVRRENEKWEKKHPGQLRIQPNGDFEILCNGRIHDAYDSIFAVALAEWNDRQIKKGCPDRCIADYYNHIKNTEGTQKNAKHVAYEIIYQVGSRDNPVNPDLAKTILKGIYDSFQDRNPNLHIVSAVIHNDESGSPHMHLIYIPVAYNCKRGLQTQTGLKAALKQQGIEGESYKDTAQMRWQQRENNALEQLCVKHGLEVIHPQQGSDVEHLSVEAYRLKKEVEEAKTELAKIQQMPLNTVMIKAGRLQQLEDTEKRYLQYKEDIAQMDRDKKQLDTTMKAYTQGYEQLQKDREEFDSLVNKLANKKIQAFKESVISFLKHINMLSQFRTWISKSEQRIINDKF